MLTKELKGVIKKIEVKKNIIAKERDDIREMYDDIGQLLESFDAGMEALDCGIRDILDAIDSISEVV